MLRSLGISMAMIAIILVTNNIGLSQLPCPQSRVIHDFPILSGDYRAAYHIISDGYVEPASTVVMTAQDHISLKPGFEVDHQATFDVFIEGCDSECSEVIPLCEGDPCPALDFKRDELGRKFVPSQIMITLPPCFNPLPNGVCQHDIIDQSYVKDIQLYLDTISLTPNGESEIRRCQCDQNIFIYESFIDINEESTIGQASSGTRPRGEGLYFSLNYHMENNLLDLNDYTDSDDINDSNILMSLFDQIKSQNPNAKVVAFLDSGIDPALIPAPVLFAQNSGACLTDDLYGWNFVDDNNDITDDRGHGTSVVLNYLNALNQMGVPLNEQAILPVKVLDECGRGTMYSVVCGLYYAASKGASIINNSWGLDFNDLQLQEAMIDLSDWQIPTSNSAGNESENLNIEEHFPSGYAKTYDKVRRNYTVIDTLGMNNVFEVGGLCRRVMNNSVATSVPLWPGSNTRDTMFTEAAIGVQDLLNTTPGVPMMNCGISGTSFAAPQFTAGLIHFCVSSSLPINHDNLEAQCQEVQTGKFSYVIPH